MKDEVVEVNGCTIEAICCEIAQSYGLYAIGMFGSRARGDAEEHSDCDFFIMGDITMTQELDIEATLESMLGVEVDVVKLTPQMDKFLAKNILNEGIVYYKVADLFDAFYESIERFFVENHDFIYFRKRDLLDQ
ncbi:MAG: nucleotidyltransferase family protein [Cellulosilyticaceae bacterium]